MQHTNDIRNDGRTFDQVRPLHVCYDQFGHADSSLILELGNTKVLCAVTLQPGVPSFMRGKQSGWLSAEYAMLPTATATRKPREAAVMRRNGRSVEISRLIGRCLRSIVDLSIVGERTILVDCDVLQADGGTRTACLTGAYVALERAVSRWIEQGIITESPLRDSLAAISVGLKGSTLLLDLDFSEDSGIDADFNFVLTRSGSIVEVQGTAEQAPISQELFAKMCTLAVQGVKEVFRFFSSNETASLDVSSRKKTVAAKKVRTQNSERRNRSEHTPLFSLKNRLSTKEQ